MRLSIVAALATTTALVACDSSTPTELPPGSPTASADRGVTASTTGGGKAQLPPGFSLLSFSFNAKAKADGSASGQFRQVYESSDGSVDFQGTVTCVTFDPVNGRAWIGGVITKNNSTDPAVLTPIHEVGKEAWFRVVDYGEGQSPDDRTTVLGFEGGLGIITSEEYCQLQLWREGDVGTWAVVDGNIQVRP
jgi:hypothetical protein